MEWVRLGPPGIFLGIHVVNGEHALLEGAAMRCSKVQLCALYMIIVKCDDF